jgi:GntR family transcriptional regulator
MAWTVGTFLMPGGLMAIPLYRQIAEDLRQRIESGELGPGDRLPSEFELREHYDTSRNTVRDASKWLIALGLVESRPGQGIVVATKIDPFVTTLSSDPATGLGGGEGAVYLSEANANHRKAFSSPVQVEIQQASGEIAAKLRIPPGAEVISRHEKRFLDGTAWSLQTSFYPMSLASQGARRLLNPRDIAEGTVRYFADVLGLRQVGYSDWIIVRAPNPTEADFFKLPPIGQVAVFEIFRTAFDQHGMPIRLTVTVFPADRNQLIVHAGAVPAPHDQPEEPGS